MNSSRRFWQRRGLKESSYSSQERLCCVTLSHERHCELADTQGHRDSGFSNILPCDGNLIDHFLQAYDLTSGSRSSTTLRGQRLWFIQALYWLWDEVQLLHHCWDLGQQSPELFFGHCGTRAGDSSRAPEGLKAGRVILMVYFNVKQLGRKAVFPRNVDEFP